MSQDTTYRVFDHGDFQVRLAYVNPEPLIVNSEASAAMMLVGKRNSSRSAWIIMLDSAWKYVDDNDSHSKYMQVASGKIASEFLNLGNDRMTAFRVAEAILEHIPDLLEMPPYQKPIEVVGSVEGMIGDQRIESEILH
jgi:hypothetical protein